MFHHVPIACSLAWKAEGSFPDGSLGPLVGFLSSASAALEKRRAIVRAARTREAMLRTSAECTMAAEGGGDCYSTAQRVKENK